MNNQVFGIDADSDGDQHWPIGIDGPEIRHLRTRYAERVDEPEWEVVRDTAARILTACPAPNGPDRTVTALALGKVQSGKTLSYTALIALGIDNGYRISIVLAGTKNALLQQNYSRLCFDLETSNRASITPFRNPSDHDAEVVRSVLYGGGHVLIVVLKHRQHIENAQRVLSTAESTGHPTLIIDDEGDEASLNTQFRRRRQSPVYRSIVQLRASLSKHSYVAYTATPQANLLVEGIDGLSPDVGVLVQPGAGYCGGSVYFGTDRAHYLRALNAQETNPTTVARITPGLSEALAMFVVGAAIRHLRQPGVWHSMLIHKTERRDDHQALHLAVRTLLEQWRDVMRLRESDPAARHLRALMRAAFDDLRQHSGGIPSWDQVVSQIETELWLIEVWMVNSLPLGRDPVATPFRLMNNVFIGGNMMARGVTIEGLAVTYITRRAQNDTNADTIEQRARWFGYKASYLDLCRLYMTQQLATDYTELLRHEDDFWDALSRSERQGLSIRQWPRMFSLNRNLGINPTRASVARFRRFRGSAWDVQGHLARSQSIADANVELFREFIRENPGVSRHFGNTEHQIISDFPTDRVISQLLARFNPDGTDWENAYTTEFLARLFLSGQLPTIDLLIMARGNVRNRSETNGRVNPMQGETPNRVSGDAGYYPGDDNIHGGRVQLQLHIIQVRGDNFPTTAFALYVPNDPRYDLHFVVRDDPT